MHIGEKKSKFSSNCVQMLRERVSLCIKLSILVLIALTQPVAETSCQKKYLCIEQTATIKIIHRGDIESKTSKTAVLLGVCGIKGVSGRCCGLW